MAVQNLNGDHQGVSIMLRDVREAFCSLLKVEMGAVCRKLPLKPLLDRLGCVDAPCCLLQLHLWRPILAI